MKIFFVLMATILFFAFDAAADETTDVICKIVEYAHSIGGPIITVVIIGAALLAIFGRMPWPALVALGIFTGVFFGAPKVAKAVSGKETCSTTASTPPASAPAPDSNNKSNNGN